MFCPELHDIGKIFDNNQLFKDDRGDYLTTDKKKLVGHSLSNLDWKHFGLKEPSTSTWKGVKFHHSSEKDLINSELTDDRKKQILILKFADRLAAQFGRMNEKVGKIQLGKSSCVRKPWTDSVEDVKQETLINTKEGFEAIINKINNNVQWEDFKKDYSYYLSMIPEDKTIGNSFHTLQDHMELTGKFYRQLEDVCDVIIDNVNNKFILIYKKGDQCIDNINGAKEFKFNLVRADIMIPHRFARIGDLSLFIELENAINKILKDSYSKHVLFNTANTIWFLLPVMNIPDEMETVFKPITDLNCSAALTTVDGPVGFLNPGYLDYKNEINASIENLRKDMVHLCAKITEKQNDIKKIKSSFPQIKNKDEKSELGKKISNINEEVKQYENEIKQLDDRLNNLKNNQGSPGKWIEEYKDNIITSFSSVYSNTLKSDDGKNIEPPICEVCQLKKGGNETKDKTVEFLCQECRDMREKRTKLTGLAKWDEKNYRVAWVRITLDYDVFAKIQLKNYVKWITDFSDENGNKLNEAEAAAKFNPCAAHAVLTQDYNNFLVDLNCHIKKKYDDKKIFFIGMEKKCELFVFSIRNSDDLAGIITTFTEKLGVHFNFFKENHTTENNSSPIKLAVSISSIKYPFYRHWDFLDNPLNDVNIFSPNKGSLSISAAKLQYLMKMKKSLKQYKSKTLIHKMAHLENRLGNLAMEVEMLNNKNAAISMFLQEAKSKGITAREILSYYRIVLWDL